MSQLNKEELQILNDIGNIKSFLVTHTKVQEWNSTDKERIYDAQVRQLSHTEIKNLARCSLNIWSVFVNQDKTLSVKIARRKLDLNEDHKLEKESSKEWHKRLAQKYGWQIL